MSLPSPKPKPVVYLFANTKWFLANFKLDLILELYSQGYSVNLLYLRYGPFADPSISRYIECDSLVSISSIFRLLLTFGLPSFGSPHRLLVFTVGPIIISGLIFPHLNHITCITLEGLGRLFSSTRVVYRILKRFVESFYRVFFCHVRVVVVLNHMDYVYLATKLICPFEKIKVIPGTGIDLNQLHDFAVLRNTSRQRFIDFVGRCIPEKGFYDFVACAQYIKSRYPSIASTHRFRIICPQSDIDNFTTEQISYLADSSCDVLPYISDVKSYLCETAVLVHPTRYGEGLSRIVLESALYCIPIVTTKNRGTVEVLGDDYPFYSEVGSPHSISFQIYSLLLLEDDSQARLLQLSQNVRSRFCNAASTDQFLKAVDI